MLVLLQALLFGWLSDDTAKRKGYKGGFWWGFWLSFIGFLIVVLRPDNKPPEEYMYTSQQRQVSQPQSNPKPQSNPSGSGYRPNSTSDGWTCACGKWNPSTASSCKFCYLQKSEALKPKMICPACGARNRYDLDSCYACGCPLPREHASPSSGSGSKNDPPKVKPQVSTWTCTCGSVNPSTMKSCPSCFKSKDWFNEGAQSSDPVADQPRPTRRRRNPTSQAQEAKDYMSVLEQLAKLHDQGILTDEEFAQKKAEILAKM